MTNDNKALFAVVTGGLFVVRFLTSWRGVLARSRPISHYLVVMWGS